MHKVEGFTLVELAIVMIIIGLLIGGVLKGQELVSNGQITATVAQIKSISAATLTFRDKYNALPGDMVSPADRLVNCTGQCMLTGNGNGRLEYGPVAFMPSENRRFFPHLAAADLMTGVTAEGGITAWGQSFPAAKIRGGFHPGYHQGGVGVLGAPVSTVPGHYLWLFRDLTAPAIPGNVLTGIEALRIDRKIDDGLSTSGSVFPTGGGACVYNETGTNTSCDLVIKFQD